MRQIVLLFTCLVCCAIYGQELKVKQMTQDASDLSARTYGRQDVNDKPCALVKVQLAAYGAQFEGNVIGSVVYKTGEYWVYMSEGSRELRIKHPNFLPLHVNFMDYGLDRSGVRQRQTYTLVVTKPVLPVGQVEDSGASYLIMTVEPKNSTVFVDDKLQTVTDGMVRISLPYGQHRYRVDANGYATKQGVVDIGPERKDLTVTLESQMGSLRVSCGTAGVSVYINDQLRGTAPWSGQLPPGTYIVEARKPGSHPQRETITLAEREDRSIVLPVLIAQVGSLDVDYQPINAEVYMDGTLLGRSPNVFRNIATGSHTVEIRSTGYTLAQQTVTVSEGQTARIAGALSRLPSEDAEIAGKTPEQIRSLSYYYCNGTGGKSVDYAKAMKYARIAAERGNAVAMNDIGLMYERGQGVAKDMTEAAKWYRKSAEAGSAWGQHNLGYSYREGEGVPQDYAEALKWYRKAVEQGHAGAMIAIGVMYELGQGVDKDMTEAVKWYRKVAEAGDDVGQYDLGLCYQYGKGVSIDLSLAKYWYEKAAAQGHENAKKRLAEMK